MKKVKQPRREKKTVILEEKQLKEATGSSGYMVSWGFTDDENPDRPYGGG